MRRSITVGTMASALCAGAVLAGEIDPGLQHIIDQTPPDQSISALLYLHEQLDTQGIDAAMDAKNATLRERHEVVVRNLQDIAARTQGNLLNSLGSLQDAGRIDSYTPYWVANLVRVDAPPAEITALANRPDVYVAYYNYGIELIEPADHGAIDHGHSQLTPEIGLEAIRAPEVWNDLGFDGTGVLVSTLDTGVDGNHVALKDRWRGAADSRYKDHPEWAFFDPVTNRTFPFDSGVHGTHTMGTVCGGPPGDQIGVAPGAQFIQAAVIDRVSIQRTVADAILAFQWIIDPDGDPSTNWDVPATCSNSWGVTTGHGYPPCDDTFWVSLDNTEAAGIVQIFSAGNEGFGGLRRPADRATTAYNAHAVAAVDANNSNWPIASFSSRGPTFCTPDGSEAIKPDISAPGVNVRSAFPGNSYGVLSGTSMASPHINGVVAMMREANPDLPVEDIKQIIYDTAVDLGSSGEDNSYGWGMVDSYEAVLAAVSLRSCMGLRVENLVAGELATFKVSRNVAPGDHVAILWGVGGNGSSFQDQMGYCATFDFDVPADKVGERVIAQGVADANGEFITKVRIPWNLAGMDIIFQAAKRDTCPDECMSHIVARTIQAPVACMNIDVQNLVAGQTATFTVSENIVRGDYVAILWGAGGPPTIFKNKAGYCATFGFTVPIKTAASRIVAQGYVDKNSEFVADVKIPSGMSGTDIMFQAMKRDTCPEDCMSNLFEGTIQ